MRPLWQDVGTLNLSRAANTQPYRLLGTKSDFFRMYTRAGACAGSSCGFCGNHRRPLFWLLPSSSSPFVLVVLTFILVPGAGCAGVVAVAVAVAVVVAPAAVVAAMAVVMAAALVVVELIQVAEAGEALES